MHVGVLRVQADSFARLVHRLWKIMVAEIFSYGGKKAKKKKSHLSARRRPGNYRPVRITWSLGWLWKKSSWKSLQNRGRIIKWPGQPTWLYQAQTTTAQPDLWDDTLPVSEGSLPGTGEGLFSSWSDRARSNRYRMKEGTFRLGIRKKFFTVKVVRHRNRLPRQTVDAPTLASVQGQAG